MKKYLKRISLLLTVVLLLLVSCSKDDSPKPPPVVIKGGEVFRSQVMTIELPNVTLSENEYQGTLGGVSITLTKLDDHKLLFPVSFATALGVNDLVISALNINVRYDVKDTVLSISAEATMEPFIAKLATYSKSLDNSPNNLSIQKSIISFNAVYANLTPAEKTEMAIMYKTNKDLIDPIFIGDFSKFNKRSKANENIITLFVLHKAAVLGIAAGAVLFELGTLPAVKVFGAVLAGVSTGFAIEHFGNIIVNRCIALQAVYDNITGVNNRISSNTANTFISFQNDVAKSINFSINNRTLISSDSNKTQSDLASFFEYNTKYNKIITNINTQITWVNNNVIFANFSLLPLEVMPTTSSTTSTTVNQTIFNKIQFTITHPNLQLVSSSLQSDGQLNIKVKIIGTPTSLPVESFLNYSYSDGFSSFSGKVPVKVDVPKCTPDMLAGNWEFKVYNCDSSNPNGYVYAGSFSKTISTTPLSYCGSSDPSTIVGGQMINNDVSNATPSCWYLNNCSVIGFSNNGYFDFVPGVSVYTVYANSTSKKDGDQHHVTMTKL